MGFEDFIEIDVDEYLFIKKVKQNLLEILFLEEKFDLVLENFYEYETELLSIASRMMIFNNDDHVVMSRERNLVSRRIVNLLTSGRMYTDQSVQHIKKIYGITSSNLDIIKKEIKIQYDKSLGYRVMEALRNYVQHRGFPIHSIKFIYSSVDIDNDFQLLYRAIPLINIAKLDEDSNFKKRVLEELKNIQHNDWVDVKPLIREYIEGICNIHEKVRETIRPDLLIWERILDDTIEKFQNKFGKDVSLTGLIIAIAESDRRWTEKETIHKAFIERRQVLEKKNQVFINLHKRYVSNEIRKDDA